MRISITHRTHPGPLTAATIDRLVITQDPTHIHAISNGSPATLCGPPLTVYHSIFAKFIRLNKAKVKPIDIGAQDLQVAHLLNSAAAKYSEDMDMYLGAILGCMTHFLGDIRFQEEIRSDSKVWKPDGHIPVQCGLYQKGEPARQCMVKFFFEFAKSGISSPIEQAEHDYLLTCTSPLVRTLLPLYDESSNRI